MLCMRKAEPKCHVAGGTATVVQQCSLTCGAVVDPGHDAAAASSATSI